MDFNQLLSIIKDLGLPAIIFAILSALAKALATNSRRRSKETTLKWLGSTAAREPFQDDPIALRAINNLHKDLAFEKAFGLHLKTSTRDRILRYAEANADSIELDVALSMASQDLLLKDLHDAKLATTFSKTFNILGLVLHATFIGYCVLFFSFINEFMNNDNNTFIIVTLFLTMGALLLFTANFCLDCSKKLTDFSRLLDWELQQTKQQNIN